MKTRTDLTHLLIRLEHHLSCVDLLPWWKRPGARHALKLAIKEAHELDEVIRDETVRDFGYKLESIQRQLDEIKSKRRKK